MAQSADDEMDAWVDRTLWRLDRALARFDARPPLPVAPDPPPDDEPISGDYGEPVEAPMAAYLAQFAPLAQLDARAEARREFALKVLAGEIPANATWVVDGLYRTAEAANEARAKASRERDAVPEGPIDWRTFRDERGEP